jgi:flagellum-specific peptidoglycan hydrolase FlgJ
LPGQGLTVLPVPGVLHTVADGETVALLAERYKVTSMTLIEANGLVEPYALRKGDELLVPNGQPLPSTLPGAVPWPAPGTGVQFKQQFIEAAAAPARESQRRSGAPASVAIAQAIHETGWGSSRLAREAHNYFGIKGRNSEGPAGVVWMNTWEVIGGRNITAREPFRAYNTPEESFLDYGLFFIQNRRYHGALAVADDPQAFIQAIAAAGFATDPNYAARIIRMMDQYDLYRYDRGAAVQRPAQPPLP